MNAIKPVEPTRPTISYYYYMLVLLAALVAMIKFPSIAGFNLSGWAWVVVLYAGIIVILTQKGMPNFPIMLWLPFFFYAIAGTDFSDRGDMQRLGMFMCPLVVGISLSKSKEVDLCWVRKSYYFFFIATLLIYILAAGMSGTLTPKRMYNLAGPCMCMVLISIVATGDWNCGKVYPRITLALSWIYCVVTESRNPVLTIPILFVFACEVLSWRRRAAVILLICATAVMLSHTAAFRENIFRSDEGEMMDILTLDREKIDAGGRLYTWPVFWQEIMEKPWLGHGGNASTRFSQAQFNWGHPHNEGIRLLFDYGIVGTALFLLPIIRLLCLCYYRARKNSGELRKLYRFGFFGLIGMFLLGATGNVLLYVVWYGNPLFGAIGLACAAEPKRSSDEVRLLPSTGEKGLSVWCCSSELFNGTPTSPSYGRNSYGNDS